MNDERSERGDPFDQRMDAALRRLFAAPPALEQRTERWLPTSARLARRVKPVYWFAAAAAAVLALGLWVAEKRSPAGRSPSTLSMQRVARAFAPVCWPMIGPPEEPELDEVLTPDLTLLYRAMDACQRSAAAVSCGENQLLAEQLHSSYGQEIELIPEAVGLLQGPFASPEWPSGTILTGFADNQTSVLVADSDDTLACCLRMSLPEDSGLQVFTWPVGNLSLTEITPLPEPHLLTYFDL